MEPANLADARPGRHDSLDSTESRGWLGRLVDGIGGRKPEPPTEDAADANPLLEFAEEEETAFEPEVSYAPMQARSATARRALTLTPGAIAALVGVISVGAVAVGRMVLNRSPAAATQSGTLRIETQPAGATVVIDDTPRGATPLTVTLPLGAHRMTVRTDRDERAVAVTVTPGAQITQYFELKTPEPVAATGLSVVTEPPGGRVSVDGRARGTAPLTIADLKAGEYRVTATNDLGSAERTVKVEEGAIASLVFALPRATASLGGWISVKAPFDVDVLENAEVIGNSATTKIMLTAGRHDIVLMNRALDFRDARRVDVSVGGTTAVHVDAPTALVSANARPWADVAIDGKSVGQTPISNLRIPIGAHEVVFRHPQLGERRQSVMVTANGPNRFAVDLAN